ncbi:MAG: DUF342 domain-containing protein [Wujia sp.]
MKYKDSFFRVTIKEDGTYLSVFPPKDGGKSLDVKEVIDYLDRNGCPDYSATALKKTFDMLSDRPLQIKLSEEPIEPIHESAIVSVNRDCMVAYIRFYPPSTNGKLMSEREIRAELEAKKIIYGISDSVIEKLKVGKPYCVSIPIAKGMPPVMAKDTVIEYFFNIKPLAKPKVLEDGSVDFHALNLFSTIKKGDVLAKLTPHDPGKPGMDIMGRNIPQNHPKIKKLKYGRNILLSEDGTTVTSEVDGNVTLADGTIFVSDTYNVAADVDASTGDIEYEGNVMIPGTVRTGFTVRAKGDIEVNGVVEGATLIAGGNIVIKRGVQGMGKGRLESGGDICAQFFESANVSANGDIIAGSILHSHIQSGGKVVISGKKGFIVGGEIICESYVEANSIGNRMETQTLIKVGVKPELYERMKVLVPLVAELKTSIEETTSYLNVYKEKIKRGVKLTPENVKQIKQYTEKTEEMKQEYQEKNEELQNIRTEISYGKKGSVKVFGNIFRGAVINISSLCLPVKDTVSHSWFKILDGEIKSTSF